MTTMMSDCGRGLLMLVLAVVTACSQQERGHGRSNQLREVDHAPRDQEPSGCAESDAAPGCSPTAGEPASRWKNPECSACAAEYCSNAELGYQLSIDEACPASDLDCRAAVDCMLDASCVSPVLGGAPCYCGTAGIAGCFSDATPGHAEGVCASEIARAHGPKATRSIIGRDWNDPKTSAGGRAGYAITCLAQLCHPQCFGPAPHSTQAPAL